MKCRASRCIIQDPRNAIFGINIIGLSFLTLAARFSVGGKKLFLFTDLEGLCLISKVEDSYITSKDPSALMEIFMSNTENQYLMTWFSYGTLLYQEQDISVECPGLAVLLFGEILCVFPCMLFLQRSIRISSQFW